jgi:hypothetical protein
MGYQRGFYIVLFAVFMTNLFCLIYFIMNKGLVTDFSEPPNLFGISINSPPSKIMAGSCGGGPEGKQYTVKWGVEMEGDGHLFIADKPRSIYNTTGARAESKASFADLLTRRKWRPVEGRDAPMDNIELGRKNTAYSGAGAVEDDEDTPLPKIKQQESGLLRMYSKIAKRKSVL